MMPAAPARAEIGCDGSEASCILDAAWAAALVLPDEKRTRVEPLFVAMAAKVGEPDLLQRWTERFTLSPAETEDETYIDFGWKTARGVIDTHGVDGLIKFAKEKRAPLALGRGDTLLAAGKRLAHDQPAQAEKLNVALMDLAATASSFEAPDLASAAAELAMYRCDLEMFDRAAARTHAPGNMRYAFWRARMTGNGGQLRQRIVQDADAQDTRHVRQVFDGYRSIVELGYCK